MNKDFLKMQKLAGLITEGQYKKKINENYDEFINLVADNIFTAGVNDPTMSQVNDWDTLFEYWEDFGDLDFHTQSDIIGLAKQANVSQNDIEYILDLPQVSKLEKG